MSVVAAI